MTTTLCQFDQFCISKDCPFQHSYPFKLEDYQIPKQPRMTIDLPCYLSEWKYLERAIGNIKTIEDLQKYMASMFTNEKDKREKEITIKELPSFKNLNENEKSIIQNELIPLCKEMIINHQNILLPPPVILYKTGKVMFTRKQSLCLISCMLFGLYSLKLRKDSRKFNEYAQFPFFLFREDSVSITMTQCIIHYFHLIFKEITNDKLMNEIIEIERHSSKLSLKELLNSNKKIIPGDVDNIHGIMEINETENLKADFANKYIGGGVLHGGCVQEEIMFMECPEMFISMITNPVMDDQTTILFKNIIRYVKIKGYGRGIQFNKEFEHLTSNNIVALDALVAYINPKEQYNEQQTLRELNKIFSGVECLSEEDHLIPFISGKWGCGVFGGDWRYKYILQTIICSYVERPFIFTSFHDNEAQSEIEQFKRKIENDNPSISDFIQWLVSFCSNHENLPYLLTSPTIPTASHPFKPQEETNNKCTIV
ncbi:Poly(ADP-ribose) glycohydrolase, putative [Entamoeba histolytica HM-1:IMSS-B]|uniref:poly(ADP-ribose) glycohydrolase n=5 Tax=Entamoeba histolytica TaxID=5759 RepID=M3UV22_ENTH1|nr:poly(ADPribose) glycohydrolase, putative [Entamoeba histolytica KU27]EMH75257.1 Poly(ADP-ribose) glycohydrolase, putative [Entamoeba histolytica HM-1:IMSS-B]EMS15796.1 poly(ADP-ribose) glycohydrolase [Entamoeba histolytica HM-3:IMSS]ENY59947.1 poly(ADP-ribose) glycohydrolase, putative [Entamoeba histolytica HM-1:IMSS-A]